MKLLVASCQWPANKVYSLMIQTGTLQQQDDKYMLHLSSHKLITSNFIISSLPLIWFILSTAHGYNCPA